MTGGARSESGRRGIRPCDELISRKARDTMTTYTETNVTTGVTTFPISLVGDAALTARDGMRGEGRRLGEESRESGIIGNVITDGIRQHLLTGDVQGGGRGIPAATQ